MNPIEHYIRPRVPGVARLLLGRRADPYEFADADLPTLIALILMAITLGVDDRLAIIAYVQDRSLFDRALVDFLLDQYNGQLPQYHLWYRDAAGRYHPLT